jgi:Domain of unknown function (DUF222)
MQALVGQNPRDLLRDGVDALVEEPLEGCSTHALGEDLVDIRAAIDRLEAEFIRRLDRFHRRQGGLSQGGVSTVSWLRSQCGMTVKAAAHRVHMSDSLGAMPATLDAAREGGLPFANLAMLARLAGDVGAERLSPLEPALINAAQRLDPGRMRIVAETTRLHLDPDGVLADAPVDLAERQLRCGEHRAVHGQRRT